MTAVYIIAGILVVVLLFRMIKIVPGDSICIVEKKSVYHKTLQPGFHVISPMYSQARIVPVEEKSTNFSGEKMNTSEGNTIEAASTVNYKLWDPYKPFFEFENLDREVMQRAKDELTNIVATYSIDAAFNSLGEIEDKLQDKMNSFGKSYGMEFSKVAVNLH